MALALAAVPAHAQLLTPSINRSLLSPARLEVAIVGVALLQAGTRGTTGLPLAGRSNPR